MEKLTMTVEEAGKVLGVSRPTAYKLVQRADFHVVRVGHRLLVSTEGLREWVKKEAGAIKVKNKNPPRQAAGNRPVLLLEV